ncbi:hypothetical protein STAS_24237 [Striga asiatica]|uniref:Uncharacterized protein n=1 Tax=Striga asiatica TaxID=4170 RepID=A0A5A7QQK0_STRAF|nr:hypothetical protein STAS_24237 [Striga asiatica]
MTCTDRSKTTSGSDLMRYNLTGSIAWIHVERPQPPPLAQPSAATATTTEGRRLTRSDHTHRRHREEFNPLTSTFTRNISTIRIGLRQHHRTKSRSSQFSMEQKNPRPASSEEFVDTGPKFSFMAVRERTVKKKSMKSLFKSSIKFHGRSGLAFGPTKVASQIFSVAMDIKGAAKVKIRCFPWAWCSSFCSAMKNSTGIAEHAKVGENNGAPLKS